MRINLITAEEYAILQAIQAGYKALTYQNRGYEGLNKNNLTQEEKDKFQEVTAILKKSIIGFSEFQHFKISKTNIVYLRFQYDWTAHDRSLGIPFTGVGYIELDELLNGFKE